jgi:glyoxylase-like metal-dependent hydrolase (beta-lactamase superfamily II)
LIANFSLFLRLPGWMSFSRIPGFGFGPALRVSENPALLRKGASMSSIDTNDGNLKWKVLTNKRPGLSRDLPPGKEELMWVSNSSTLIYGERDAVLVDTFLTIEQSQALLNWVIASGKNLTAIYLTHGHGDHVFGVGSLLEHFPNAKAVATPEVVEGMRQQVSPTSLENFWRKLFPGQIPEHLPIADPLQSNELELEGYKLVAINAGKTDTAQSTCLHVPSVGLLIGGDVVYNGIHPYLAETSTESRREWIATLDKLEALNPRAVIAGHKVPENNDDPRIIAETRQYLRDFNRLDEATTTARELYDAMLELYPDRANPGSLWGGAKVAKTSAQQ